MGFFTGFALPVKSSGLNVIFINDYKKLWNYFALSHGDLFGRNALLFETVVMVLFDKRAISAVIFITTYDVIIYLILCFVQPNMVAQLVVQMIIIAGLCALYVSCAYVFKCTLSSNLFDTTSRCTFESSKSLVASNRAKIASEQLYTNASYYPMFALFRTFLHTIYMEMLITTGLHSDYMVTVEESCSQLQEAKSTLDENDVELSTSAVEVIRSKESQLLEMQSNCSTQCAYYMLLNVGAKFLDGHTLHALKINNTARIMLAFSVILVPILYLYNFIVLFMSYSVVFPGTNKIGFLIGLHDFSQFLFLVLSFGTVTYYIIFTVCTLSMLVAVIGMLYGALILHELATCWVERYSGLRKYNSKVIEENTENDTLVIDGLTTCSRSLTVHRIERDAYEHYLFIQEFVTQNSNNWSPFLLLLIFVSGGFVSFCLYFILTVKNVTLLSWIWICVICIFTILFPIYCMAYANNAMNTIVTCFRTGSTPADYDILGGRDVWMNYVNEEPAYWRLFGVAITWGVLYSTIGTLSAAFVGTAISALFAVINN